jgi:hypothetical protein
MWAASARRQAWSATGMALLAAVFIIFTTLSMEVTKRVRQLAVLRAVGIGRAAIGGLEPKWPVPPDLGRGRAHRTGRLHRELGLRGDGRLVRDRHLAICELFRRDGNAVGRTVDEDGRRFWLGMGALSGWGVRPGHCRRPTRPAFPAPRRPSRSVNPPPVSSGFVPPSLTFCSCNTSGARRGPIFCCIRKVMIRAI